MALPETLTQSSDFLFIDRKALLMSPGMFFSELHFVSRIIDRVRADVRQWKSMKV